MQVRQELSQLCFLCDDIRFESQFLFFTPAEAFLKPLNELDPASDLARNPSQGGVARLQRDREIFQFDSSS